jgi:putative tryptophan/tyrosine transport system substrate-binding protein
VAGLRELGWVETQNLVLERRYAEGQTERLSALAAELVQMPVEVLVAGAAPPALSRRRRRRGAAW